MPGQHLRLLCLAVALLRMRHRRHLVGTLGLVVGGTEELKVRVGVLATDSAAAVTVLLGKDQRGKALLLLLLLLSLHRLGPAGRALE